LLRYNDIADRMLEYIPSCDLGLLEKAYVFSAKVHEGQERLSGEPYLVHPLEVAGILVDTRMDEITVVAGLLHDSVEDTLTSIEEIRRLFGDQVAFIVEGLTKIAKIEFKSDQERQADMRTLKYMPDDARRRIAQETADIYGPLAHRLGIHWMKQELEELAFRTLNPMAASELERMLHSKHKAREVYVEEVIGVVSKKLLDSGLNSEVTGRLKDLSSIHAKMQSQGLSLDEIYDAIAFRIVLEGRQEEVYHALGIVHSTWRPVAGRFKDYVALPKPNGYQSLHTTVIGSFGERMEMQIRTQDMHDNAEFGIAAHWKYKEGRLDVDSDDEKFAWLRQLLEWHRELADPHEFIDTVKVDLFPGEVFVFTPKGEVIDLSRGATALDFAYAIHTEVGARCSGARVNGKMVPLRHRLADGDTVEIATSKHQYPRKDWLDFVVTGRARSRIRHAIRAGEKDRSRELGQEILGKELRKRGLSIRKLLEAGDLEEFAKASHRGSVNDLFSAVGYGRASAVEVVRKLRGVEQGPVPLAPEQAPKRRRFFRRRDGMESTSSGIRVSGQADVLVRFGRCCAPLPGDDVVGFVTRGRGVTVHTRNCTKAFELDPERRIAVEWHAADAPPRRVKMRVRSADVPGLLAKVTKTISKAEINISGARVTTSADQRAIHTFDLWVSDVETLNAVMKEIERIKGVQSVERMRA